MEQEKEYNPFSDKDYLSIWESIQKKNAFLLR